MTLTLLALKPQKQETFEERAREKVMTLLTSTHSGLRLRNVCMRFGLPLKRHLKFLHLLIISECGETSLLVAFQ